MKITLSGFNGIFTGATITPYVGMTFMGKQVVKVNEKSLLIAPIGKPDMAVKHESFSMPYWALSSQDCPLALCPEGKTYVPTHVENALLVLCQQDPEDAALTIGAIAENFVKSGQVQNERVAHFDSLSGAAVLFTIDKLIN